MGKKRRGENMNKALISILVISMLCISISGAVVSEESNTEVEYDEESYAYMQSIVNRLAKLKQEDFKPVKNDVQYYGDPQPHIGGDEVFGLWVNIIYKGESYTEQINIDPLMIKGKLTDPLYRTPIKFNVDDDPEYDIETGFGFFRYGIDEIGSDVNHPCWTTAFDFKQIYNQLDDQTAELEIWQEFHINLSLLGGKARDRSSEDNSRTRVGSKLSSLFQQLLDRIFKKFESFPLLQKILNRLFIHSQENPITDEPDEDPEPTLAGEDYYVIRVGVGSPEGEKIPLAFNKKFAAAKEGVFKPFIFQKEMDPMDIIGEDSIDVMYGFQAFKGGYTNPSYDIEFTINHKPAVDTVIQFIPIEGKISYCYDQVGATDSLDLTFTSNVFSGGDDSLSLTLTLDTPQSAAGAGKWMSFEPEILGDWEPLGGKFIYAASHKFNIGITVDSPGFEQKIEFKGLPKQATIGWDGDIEISSGEMLYLHGEGNLELSMSSTLDQVVVYYPNTNREEPYHPCVEINGIPTTTMGAEGTLNVDVDNLMNPNNYVRGRAFRTSGSDIPSIKLFLPDEETEEPIVKVTEIPAHASIQGNLEWAKLKGEVYASRGNVQYDDPVWINVQFGNYTIFNKLEIRNGQLTLRFKIAEDGYFFFDCTERMFGDILHITDEINDNELYLTVDEFSADDLQADWSLDTSGGQIQIDELMLGGFLDTLENFHIEITYEGENVQFDADWSVGQEGGFNFDYYQEDNIYMDFDLSQGDVVLYGDLELKNDLHWDVSWKWHQGNGPADPAYFRVNHNSNEPNIEDLNIYFTYQDDWGAEINLHNGGIYVCVEWYVSGSIPYIWPVVYIQGDLDFFVKLSWLTDYDWVKIV